MPGPIRIVTDSSAQFVDPSIVDRYNIVVVPLEIRLNGRSYHEGVDIQPEQFLGRLGTTSEVPALLPPPVERFGDMYAQLGRETDRILSIHLSRSIHSTWQHAKMGTERVLGRVRIEVLDSQSIATGMGLLVEAAARMAQETDSLDTVVRAVRKLIPHIYSVFCVETLEFLRRDNLLSESQVILGGMLGMKPLLTIEEGELLAMEKVRTRAQEIDKMVEFVTEFAAVEHLTILHGSTQPSEGIRQLQDRLAIEFANQAFPTMVYRPSLACYVGPDARGLMILERDLEDDGDVPFTDLLPGDET